MKEKKYEGIDYSLGNSNFDEKTGIHFGVIPVNYVSQIWYDESEGYYNYCCPECQSDLGNEYPDDICKFCSYEFDGFDFDMNEAISFYYDQDGYSLEQIQDNSDLWVFKSPFYTYSQYCSPCAPGAGYLLNYTESYGNEKHGVKTYCLSGEWFDNEIAPYPIYKIENDEWINKLFFKKTVKLLEKLNGG